jgi:glycosyltransferase involved in cell wall biosynthesis
MMEPKPIILFLPARDEAAAVAGVLARVPSAVLGHPVRVLVIDDGSTDGTAEVAAAACAEVVAHAHGQGLGAAVRTGFAAALARGAAAVAFCDADGEYDPAELERLVAPILAGSADYVVGSRFAGLRREMLPHRWAGNRVMTRWVAGIARRRFGVGGLTDGQSGYRALSPAAARAAEVIHDFNYAQVLTFDLLGKGFRYLEVPITYRFRTTGRSFVRLAPYLRQVIPAVRAELRDQSSTTKDRKAALASAQRVASIEPPGVRHVAAARPMASTWWVLSGTNSPWRPRDTTRPRPSDRSHHSSRASSQAKPGR